MTLYRFVTFLLFFFVSTVDIASNIFLLDALNLRLDVLNHLLNSVVGNEVVDERSADHDLLLGAVL